MSMSHGLDKGENHFKLMLFFLVPMKVEICFKVAFTFLTYDIAYHVACAYYVCYAHTLGN